MSLIGFHKFLISIAILFCLGFAIRQWSEFRVAGNPSTLMTATAFGLAGVGLGYYLKHLHALLRLPSQGGVLAPTPKSRARSVPYYSLQTSDSRRVSEAAGTLSEPAGNGDVRVWDWAAPQSKPAMPSKDNGHGGRATTDD